MKLSYKYQYTVWNIKRKSNLDLDGRPSYGADVIYSDRLMGRKRLTELLDRPYNGNPVISFDFERTKLS